LPPPPPARSPPERASRPARPPPPRGGAPARSCVFGEEAEPFRNGERSGTHVLALTRDADETIAANADEIEPPSTRKS
ncbi:hypothetical protein, partial [Streptomyces inusitatus]|uniref:hypothetical protein n=1 Tax=Streptomyces inusitatus TaxID=68221 RepID=UPI001E39E55E